jgi:succinoglycan biosynthesis transport protein ExoP
MRFSPIDPVKVLRQYKLLLAIAGVAGLVVGLVAYFVLAKVAPEYTARTTVSVSGQVDNPMSLSGRSMGGGDDLETFKLTQAYYMSSPEILSATLELQSEVKKTAWYLSYGDDALKRQEDFRSMVNVTPVRNTNVIEVRVSAPDAASARDLCNGVVDTYRARVERDNRDQRGQLTAVFANMSRQKQEDIASLRGRINDLMSATDFSAAENRFHEVEAIFQQLITEKFQLDQQLQLARRSYDGLIQAQQEQTFDFSPVDYATVDADPSIKSRDDRILALQEELRVAQERFGANHRTVRDLEFRIQATGIEKQRERDRLLRELWDLKVSQAESGVSALAAQLANIEQRLATVREQRRELNSKINDYAQLRQELERREAEAQQFESMLGSMALLREDPRAVRVRLGPRARAPQDASFPKIQIMVPAATILLLGLATGVVFLKELLDQRIKGPSCAKMLPKADLLGVVPHAEDDPSGHGSIDMVVLHEPTSLMTEAFRQVRTEVLSRMERHGQKTLMLVGSQAGGGVSAVATNLAISIAMNNRKVVLLDANFRRPSLHRTFDLPEKPGMADLLGGHATLEQAVQKTHVANLDVIPIGSDRAAVFEHLESPACQQAMDQLEASYDLVLIDAPPLSIVGDSRLLASQVDAVLLVVRAMTEKRGLVSRVMRQLEHVRAELVGIVINGVRTSAGGYFRDNYRAFYEYQNTGGAERGPRRSRPTRGSATRTAEAAERLAGPRDKTDA